MFQKIHFNPVPIKVHHCPPAQQEAAIWYLCREGHKTTAFVQGMTKNSLNLSSLQTSHLPSKPQRQTKNENSFYQSCRARHFSANKKCTLTRTSPEVMYQAVLNLYLKTILPINYVFTIDLMFSTSSHGFNFKVQILQVIGSTYYWALHGEITSHA